MGLPRITPTSGLSIFKFYKNRAIYEAIFYEGNVLKLAKIFHAEHREEAYRFAYKLSQEYITVISPCSTLYRIWVDTRCPIDFQLSFQLDSLEDDSTHSLTQEATLQTAKPISTDLDRQYSHRQLH